MQEPARGSVITFYSYKGGTGRSMALANVAWILASNGRRVLTIDWDLEAPGLHRYFAPFLVDPELETADGLIDFIYQYLVATTTKGSDAEGWYDHLADLRAYAEPIQWSFPDGGSLELVGAGRQSTSYGDRVNGLDWTAFYKRFGGGRFLDSAFDSLRGSYDYILIDSRTGVADTAGICSVHLPDSLAVFFTLNNQSIEGASAVAETAFSRRAGEKRPLQIYPVTTRVEKAEKDKLEARRAYATGKFSNFPAHLNPDERAQYVRRMEVLYEPFYAYEEVLAPFADRGERDHGLLSSMLWLTSQLTDGGVSSSPPLSATQRSQAMQLYAAVASSLARSPAPEKRWDVFITARPHDREAASYLYEALHGRCEVFWAEASLLPGDDREAVIGSALRRCRTHVVFISEASQSAGPWFEKEISTSFGRRAEGEQVRMVPVLLYGPSLDQPAAQQLKGFAAKQVDTPDEVPELASEILGSMGLARSSAISELESLREAVEAKGQELARKDEVVAQLHRSARQNRLRWRVTVGILATVALAGFTNGYMALDASDGAKVDLAATREELQRAEHELDATRDRLETVEVTAGELAVTALTQQIAQLESRVDAWAEAARAYVDEDQEAIRVIKTREVAELTLRRIESLRGTATRLSEDLEALAPVVDGRTDVPKLIREQMTEKLNLLRGTLETRQPGLQRASEALQARIANEFTASKTDLARTAWERGLAELNKGSASSREEAKLYFQEAIGHAPGYARPYNSLGALALNEGNYAQAEQYLLDALKRDSRYTPTLNNLTLSYLMRAERASGDEKQAELKKAKKYNDASLKRDPSSNRARGYEKEISAALGPRPDAVKNVCWMHIKDYAVMEEYWQRREPADGCAERCKLLTDETESPCVRFEVLPKGKEPPLLPGQKQPEQRVPGQRPAK